MNEGRFYVFYIDTAGMNSAAVTKMLTQTRDWYTSQNIIQPDERWLFLPSDKNQLQCITPSVITDKQRSEEFINEFLDLKLKIEKEYNLGEPFIDNE